MIAKGGESTFSTNDGGDRIAPPDQEGEIQSIFCKLTTAELLKHLLSSRVNNLGCHDETNASYAAKKRAYDSSHEAASEATDPSLMKRTFCSKSTCDKCDSADNNGDAICGETGRGYESFRDGIMSEQDAARQNQSHLCGSEVQSFRENLQRNLSEESSVPEQFSDEEITSFSKAILSSDTLDFILSGTEKNLCIQTPSPKENISECTLSSDFSDFTELLPFVGESRSTEVAFSPVASTSGVSKVSTKTETDISVNSDKKTETVTGSTDSDQDVNDAMVLVPSDPLEWTSSHIKSWLEWSTRKFSLQPKPELEKFPKTGVEICELSRTEFETRAGCPRSGTILAKYIAHLRHSVTGRSSSPLNVECKEYGDDSDEEEQAGRMLSKGFMELSDGGGSQRSGEFIKENYPPARV